MYRLRYLLEEWHGWLTVLGHARQPVLVVGLIAANLPVYVLIGRWIFQERASLLHDMRVIISPDLLNLWRDEYDDVPAAAVRLILFTASCFILTATEYWWLVG